MVKKKLRKGNKPKILLKHEDAKLFKKGRSRLDVHSNKAQLRERV